MMLKISVAGVALAVFVAPAAAMAQPAWVPGSEITGQTVQVQTNGVMNTVYFGPGGSATITAPNGQVVPATWTAAGGNLCLSATGAQECWPYAQPFMAGQQMALTSNCGSSSTWLAEATNAPPAPPLPPPPPPAAQPSGERG